MFSSDRDIVLFLFIIPVVAVIGGITMGIIRLRGQQRLEELARKERIAAIERGLDPDKIAALSQPAGYEEYGIGNGRLRRAHGLLIAGLVLIASGIAIGILIQSQQPSGGQWTVGLMPGLVGVALLIASRLVWPQARR